MPLSRGWGRPDSCLGFHAEDSQVVRPQRKPSCRAPLRPHPLRLGEDMEMEVRTGDFFELLLPGAWGWGNWGYAV